jgi:hypothetical protein
MRCLAEVRYGPGGSEPFSIRRQQLFQPVQIVIQEVARHGVMFRVLIGDLGNAAAVERQNLRAKVGKQNRRMRRDDELRLFLRQRVNGPQSGLLAIGLERSFGFVQQVQAVVASKAWR